jgi:hypothetical protein
VSRLIAKAREWGGEGRDGRFDPKFLLIAKAERVGMGERWEV